MAVIAFLREFNMLSAALRLLLAMIAGIAVGFGRAQRRVNAGLRTYTLVSLGAALAVLISIYEYQMLTGGSWSGAVEIVGMKFDASRIGTSVVSGIGFLAAGTIIGVAHQRISGLTTAIGLFCAACMGLAAGAGFYEGVLISVLAIIFALELLKPREITFKRRIRNVTLCVKFDSIEDMTDIIETILIQDAQIFEMEIERAQREGDELPTAIIELKLAREKASHSALLSSVAELPCVHSVQELIY